jgi:hypothetical protein
MRLSVEHQQKVLFRESPGDRFRRRLVAEAAFTVRDTAFMRLCIQREQARVRIARELRDIREDFSVGRSRSVHLDRRSI